MYPKIKPVREYPPGSGKWRFAIIEGVDPITGKTKERTRQFKTKAEADRCYHEMCIETAAGMWRAPSDIDLVGFLRAGIEGSEAVGLRRNSAELWHRMLRLHVAPHFGTIKLEKVMPAHIQALYVKMHRRKLTGSQLAVHKMLRKYFKLALKQGIIRVDPMNAVDGPREPDRRGSDRTISPDNLVRLFRELRGHRHADLVRFMLATQMRRGEALAITWGDVDFVNGLVTVNKQLTQYADRSTDTVSVKTRAGVRVIGLHEEIIPILKARHAVASATMIGPRLAAELVFPMAESPVNFTNWFRRVCQRAGFKASPHWLRHTAITAQIMAGASVNMVSREAGHSKIAITLSNYVGTNAGDQARNTALKSRVLSLAEPDAAGEVLPLGKAKAARAVTGR
jgi:integrase